VNHKETTRKLNNGVDIPVVGFGTFKIDDKNVKELVLSAVDIGYRHIDTASYYNNEKGIGEAIKDCGLKREELFITSKLWMDDLGYNNTIKAFEKTMENLKLDYIDLYLVHWPRPLAVESWKALEEFVQQKRARAIGVCNYKKQHLEELIASTNIIPAINQIEIHPKLQQQETYEYCMKNNIAVEAWSPIMKGKVAEMEILITIGHKYNKSPAQVALRWHLQKNIIVIPKSSHQERMKQNMDIFDFNLSDEDMLSIATLEEDIRLGFDPDYIYKNGFDPKRDLK